eukprot:6407611-Pyramimonas_sp.AAC.1
MGGTRHSWRKHSSGHCHPHWKLRTIPRAEVRVNNNSAKPNEVPPPTLREGVLGAIPQTVGHVVMTEKVHLHFVQHVEVRCVARGPLVEAEHDGIGSLVGPLDVRELLDGQLHFLIVGNEF